MILLHNTQILSKPDIFTNFRNDFQDYPRQKKYVHTKEIETVLFLLLLKNFVLIDFRNFARFAGPNFWNFNENFCLL